MIQSSARNSIVGIFANPIMRKAAALVILGKRRYHKALSTQQNSEVMGREKLFSAPGSALVKTTLLKSQAKEL